MICPKCKLRYYSKTHCPNCGLDAFTLNKGRRVPVKTSYRYLNRVTILAFMVLILLGVIFIKYADQTERESAGDISLKKVSLVKVEKKTEPERTTNTTRSLKKVLSEKKELEKLNKLGIEAHNAKEYDKAFIHFYQAYSMNKQNFTIKMNLLNTLLSKGHQQLSEKRFDDAIDTFNKGLKYVE